MIMVCYVTLRSVDHIVIRVVSTTQCHMIHQLVWYVCMHILFLQCSYYIYTIPNNHKSKRYTYMYAYMGSYLSSEKSFKSQCAWLKLQTECKLLQSQTRWAVPCVCSTKHIHIASYLYSHGRHSLCVTLSCYLLVCI